MSNDIKYWIYRFAVFVVLSIDSWFLVQGVTDGFSTGEASSKATTWFVLFAIGIVAGVVLYFFYRKAKLERWNGTVAKTQEQIEVETLAAYAAQEQADKAKAKKKVDPPEAPSQ